MQTWETLRHSGSMHPKEHAQQNSSGNPRGFVDLWYGLSFGTLNLKILDEGQYGQSFWPWKPTLLETDVLWSFDVHNRPTTDGRTTILLHTSYGHTNFPPLELSRRWKCITEEESQPSSLAVSQPECSTSLLGTLVALITMAFCWIGCQWMLFWGTLFTN